MCHIDCSVLWFCFLRVKANKIWKKYRLITYCAQLISVLCQMNLPKRNDRWSLKCISSVLSVILAGSKQVFLRKCITIEVEPFICMAKLWNTIWNGARVNTIVPRHLCLFVGCQSWNLYEDQFGEQLHWVDFSGWNDILLYFQER